MSRVQNTSNSAMLGRRGTRWQQISALLALSASIALPMLLSGCTFDEQYAIFDREAERADAPPPELATQDVSGFDVDSIRFATEHDGSRLYLAKGSDPEGGICLLVDGPEDDGVTAACSTGGWVGTEIFGGSSYHVHPDGTPLPDDVYTELTPNISVEKE